MVKKKKGQINYIYTWKKFDSDIIEIEQAIKIKRWKIKCIYGIPKGGLVMAVVLANRLNLPLILNYHQYIINRKVYKPNECLIVDDIADSGRTLKSISGSQISYTITLFKKNISKFIPDMWCRTIGKKYWIKFPWE